MHSRIVLGRGVVDRTSQRDESIDKLLRSTFEADRTARETSDACVGAETIAAWTAGTLSPRETEAVQTHLARCPSCQQVLALVARTEPPAVASGFSWSNWRLRWAVPIAAAATAVAIWVAVPDDRRQTRVEDTFTPAEPQLTATDQKATDQNESAPANSSGVQRETREAAPTPAAARAAEARADAESRSAAAAASTRESDAIGPAAPETAAPPQQTRTLADAPAELLRQRREAFAGLVEVASPDPLVRWRIMPPRTLERTMNGGQTWEAVALPQAIDLTAVRAPSALTAIVTAADGRQFRTDDQGRTWNPVQP